MKYYRFYDGVNNILFTIKDKNDKDLSNPIDYKEIVKGKNLLNEIKNFREKTFSDEEDKIRTAFTIAVKIKALYLPNDTLMFDDYEDFELKTKYKIIMESDFADAVFYEIEDENDTGGYTGHEGLFYLNYQKCFKKSWETGKEALKPVPLMKSLIGIITTTLVLSSLKN